MKRYKLELTKYDRQLLDDPNGEWVRFEEAEAWRVRAMAAEVALEVYEQLLPYCEAPDSATDLRLTTSLVEAVNEHLAAKAKCERLEK